MNIHIYVYKANEILIESVLHHVSSLQIHVRISFVNISKLFRKDGSSQKVFQCLHVLGQVRTKRPEVDFLSSGQTQPSTGSFVCLFRAEKKERRGGSISMGLLLFELETAKRRTNTWPLGASHTSASHLIQCPQLPPLSSAVARFLHVHQILSCFHKGYCCLSRRLSLQSPGRSSSDSVHSSGPVWTRSKVKK